MRLEELGGEVAHQLVGVAAFDERQPFGGQRLELDRADFRAVLLALRPLLRLFVGVELTVDPSGHAVEDVGQGPEQVLEVGLEAGVGERRDEGVEDVGERALDMIRFGQWPGIGLVGEGAVAEELQLVEDDGGR